jgi:hypothetical protein
MSISLELKHLSDSLEGLFFMTTFIKHSMPQMLRYTEYAYSGSATKNKSGYCYIGAFCWKT